MHRVRCKFKIILLDFCVSVWINRVLAGAAYLHSGPLLNKTKSVQPPKAFSAHLPVMVLFWRSVSFFLLFISALCLFSRPLHPSPVFCLLSSLVKFLSSPLAQLFYFTLPFLLVPVPSSRRVFPPFGSWFRTLFLAFTLFFFCVLVFLFCYLPFAATFLDFVFLIYGDGDVKIITQTKRNIKLQCKGMLRLHRDVFILVTEFVVWA